MTPWFPGSRVEGVTEITDQDLGLTYGLTAYGRVWHGDMLTDAGIKPSPGHDDSEALLTARVTELQTTPKPVEITPKPVEITPAPAAT